MNQNNDFSSFDQIQTSQYRVIHLPSREISKEVFHAKGDLMQSIQTFLEKFNCIPFGEKPKILLQAWEKFFAIQHAQPNNSNKLFQKLLEDLQIINKELAEYNNSLSWDRPTFFNDNEVHSVQYKEYLENSSNEIAASNSNQEKEKPLQDSNIRQLVREECCTKDCRKQKQNMENTMLELVEVCRQKSFIKKQEVKNFVEQPTKCRTRIAKSLQNFRVVHKKRSISLNHTSQISPVHAITPILPNEEPEYSLSMGEYEITSDDESECDMPIKDDSSPWNPLFDDKEINSDKLDPHYFNVESDLIESLLNRDTLIDSSPKFDFLLKEFSGELTHINPILPEIKEADFDQEEEIRFVENLLYDNSSPRPPEELNAEIADIIVESLSPCPIPVEDSDSLMDEIDLFLATDDLLPLRIKSDAYDSEGDIHFLKELLVDDSISIPENESFYFDHQDDPLFPRPPPETSDVESFFDLEPGEILAMINNINELNEDECFDPGGEINVFKNVEDDDFFPFIFVIRIFLPYLIYPKVSSLLLSTGSEYTIFDPGISV
uniref:Reverse transcriptase domain-containing protein n=1 Tax=Tanacetum cinerariifolium TaxID=118510 RepID=A0A699HDQ4_TANCI|nr:hypothetical protein [Tanacetum cinerariifolium]